MLAALMLLAQLQCRNRAFFGARRASPLRAPEIPQLSPFRAFTQENVFEKPALEAVARGGASELEKPHSPSAVSAPESPVLARASFSAQAARAARRLVLKRKARRCSAV